MVYSVKAVNTVLNHLLIVGLSKTLERKNEMKVLMTQKTF